MRSSQFHFINSESELKAVLSKEASITSHEIHIVRKTWLKLFFSPAGQCAMLVVDLQIHSHHLLLALLAAPVLWAARGWCRQRQIAKANARYLASCKEGHAIQGKQPRGKSKAGEVEGQGAARLRARSANFSP